MACLYSVARILWFISCGTNLVVAFRRHRSYCSLTHPLAYTCTNTSQPAKQPAVPQSVRSPYIWEGMVPKNQQRKTSLHIPLSYLLIALRLWSVGHNIGLFIHGNFGSIIMEKYWNNVFKSFLEIGCFIFYIFDPPHLRTRTFPDVWTLERAPGPDPGRGPGRSFLPQGSSRPWAMSREPNRMPRMKR